MTGPELAAALRADDSIRGWDAAKELEGTGFTPEAVDEAEKLLGELQAHPRHNGRPADNGTGPQVEIVTARDFADFHESGAEPLVGTSGQVLIPRGSDVMLYGDGGASKTTIAIDLGVHLAAGDDWLGVRIPKPVRVGVIEAEGPRPLFREKIRRKLDGWQGSDVGERLFVLQEPWAEFRFPGEGVAERVAELEIDVMIIGPLTRVGWDAAGTLQEVREFTDKMAKFRRLTGRPLTIIVVHHQNRSGAVSGAWEGGPDTLLHAQVHARGKTTLTVQKARWASEWHKRRIDLVWTDGEGFEVAEAEERDLEAEIAALLTERPYRTAKQIAAKPKNGGIGANVDKVKKELESSPERFTRRTGEAAKAVGRHPSAVVWDAIKEVTQAPSHLESPDSPRGATD